MPEIVYKNKNIFQMLPGILSIVWIEIMLFMVLGSSTTFDIRVSEISDTVVATVFHGQSG
jgi:hypothetical protein